MSRSARSAPMTAGRLCSSAAMASPLRPPGADLQRDDAERLHQRRRLVRRHFRRTRDRGVTIDGRPVRWRPCLGRVAPPNYGTEPRRAHHVRPPVRPLCRGGWLPMPRDRVLRQRHPPVPAPAVELQWVNQGFAAPCSARAARWISKIPPFVADWRRLRRRRTQQACRSLGRVAPGHLQRLPAFRFARLRTSAWPWIYGDAFGTSDDRAEQRARLPSVQQVMLQRWADGDFIGDWAAATPPKTLRRGDTAAAAGDAGQGRAAFLPRRRFPSGLRDDLAGEPCLDFEKPFRFRLRPGANRSLTTAPALPRRSHWSRAVRSSSRGPESISRGWRLPWQGDTAFCRSGYPPPASTPTYRRSGPRAFPIRCLPRRLRVVMDCARPARFASPLSITVQFGIAACHRHRRAMMKMVADFAHMGVVEARQGIPFDPDFPAMIYVESVPDRIASKP